MYFSGSSVKHWDKRISNKNFGYHFSTPTLAFSCRQATTKVISESPLSSLTQTIWLDVYKNSVTSFCGMCCTEWWYPNLVKSRSWKSGGPTAYRLIESYWVMFGCHISHSFTGTFSDCGQLSSSSSRQLVDLVACLCLGDVISEGQRQKCVIIVD